MLVLSLDAVSRHDLRQFISSVTGHGLIYPGVATQVPVDDPQPAPVKQVPVSPSVPEPMRQALVESTRQHSSTSVRPSRPVEPLSPPDGFATPGGPPLHEVSWPYRCKGSADALTSYYHYTHLQHTCLGC